MKQVVFSLTSILLLGGCSSVPIPVANDISETTVDDSKLPQGNLTTTANVLSSMRRHSKLYSLEAYKKRRNALISSETTFYSSIVGVVGGLTKSITTAVAGGAGAAGASLYSDRYKLEIQALNYENAADAMDCMILATEPVSVTQINHYDYLIPDSGLQILASEHIKLVGANGVMQIRKRLDKLQTRFELGKPEFSKIKEVLSQQKGSSFQKSDTETAKMAIPSSEDNTYTYLINEYKTKIDGCVAAFAN